LDSFLGEKMRWANYTLDAHAKAGGCSLLLQRLAGEVVQRIRQLRHATPLRDRGGAGLPWMQVRTLKKVRKFVDRQLNIARIARNRPGPIVSPE